MAEMESKYQSEKKEQEIVLLKKEQQLKNIELQKERTTKLSAFILSGIAVDNRLARSQSLSRDPKGQTDG